jgi:hypothetical protein
MLREFRKKIGIITDVSISPLVGRVGISVKTIFLEHRN